MTKPTSPFPLDQSAFHLWLSDHPTKKVGHCYSLSHCPLANYIRHLLPPGEYHINVGVGRISLHHPSTGWTDLPAPAWVAAFIGRVSSFGDPITGADCALILDNLNKGDLL